MADWRLARCLETLRSQVNAQWPNRDKSWDGTLGDAAHAARKSEHNPDDHGVVRAMDITHDPTHGFDSYAFADFLRENWDDRVQYIISNRRIANIDVGAKAWRVYSGENPHDHHIHITVRADDRGDDPRPWNIEGAGAPPPPKEGHVLLKVGDHGPAVVELQTLLGGIDADGIFGPATTAAVQAYQFAHGLDPDGEVGPLTWAALLGGAPAEPLPMNTQTSKGSWYSQYRGKYDWHDGEDKPNSAALGVPDDAQGIARPQRFGTIGTWFMVRAPNGKVSIEQQTDHGPGASTGRTIDISAAAAERFGYSPQNFPTDSIFTFWPVDPPKEVAGLTPQQQAVKYRDIRKGLPPVTVPDPITPPAKPPVLPPIPAVPGGGDLQLYASRALQFLVDHEGNLHQLLTFAVALNNSTSPYKVSPPTGAPAGQPTDPVTQRPSVQVGVLGAIAAALGWQTGMITPDTGGLIGIAAGGIAALGATGMFGPLGKFASSAYQMWQNAQIKPPTK